jgi:hypothetical protein
MAEERVTYILRLTILKITIVLFINLLGPRPLPLLHKNCVPLHAPKI